MAKFWMVANIVVLVMNLAFLAFDVWRHAWFDCMIALTGAGISGAAWFGIHQAGKMFDRSTRNNRDAALLFSATAALFERRGV